MTEDATTKPTIETVIERINALDQKLGGRIDSLENQMNGLRSDLVNIRSDMNTGLRQVGRKIEVLNDNFLAIQATHRDLTVRVENIESQGS